jgi:SNF2 family DNA or RNA helicase
MSNQSTLEATKSIAELRKSGLDKQTLETVAAEMADIERAEKEQKTRLPGQFLSLKEDKEKKTLFFTGQYQKVDKPAIDWQTKQEIPGRMTTRFRFQCYDITDPNNLSEALIWERGRTEAAKILWHLSEENTELVVVRHGARNSQTTNYDIYPAK